MMPKRAHKPFGEPSAGSDVLWRAECQSYAYVFDAERDLWSFTDPRLELRWWRVAKRTPCGARLETGRFVNLRIEGGKEWASETIEKAIEQLKNRRKNQIHILKRQLARAELELELAKGCT